MKRIYLDHAAATPVAPEVLAAMRPYWNVKYGNPGSLHSFGQEALAAVDRSRESVAKTLGADFRNVVFTASATEANNLALRGAVGAARIISRGASRSSAPAAEADLRSRRARSLGDQAERASESRRSKQSAPPNLNGILKPRVIVSAIEHESVIETARDLARDGVEVVELPVDKKGVVDIKKLEAALDERTVLVSIMYVNNEIGTVQPVAKIAELVSKFKIQNSKFGAGYPLFHTDAAQAPAYFDCNVRELGADLMTLSSQKINGPKGVGALYINSKLEIRNSKLLSPLVTGGGQEFGLRSGTENVPGIVGFAAALELAAKNRKREFKKISALQEYFWKEVKKISPHAEVNGSTGAPHILNVYFPDQFAGDLLTRLDLAGIAASSGSACTARAFTPSHVLLALGLPGERVRGSVRFSLGPETTRAELKEAAKRLRTVLRG